MAEEQITIFDASTESHNHGYRITVNELQKELSKFNLTANQAKVYIFLGKYGSKTAPEVCKALKIARTETYHLLSTLQSKGMVTATFEHPIRFSAVQINKAIKTLVNTEKERVKFLEKQEKEISKLWQTIPEFTKNDQHPIENKFQMLQGINPILGKISEITKTTNDEILIIGSEKDFVKFYHSDVLFNISKNSKITKILSPCSNNMSHIFDNLKNTEIRNLEKIKDNICFIIRNKKEIIFFTKNNQNKANELMAMWTDSPAFVDSMILLFDFIWKQSRN